MTGRLRVNAGAVTVQNVCYSNVCNLWDSCSSHGFYSRVVAGASSAEPRSSCSSGRNWIW